MLSYFIPCTITNNVRCKRCSHGRANKNVGNCRCETWPESGLGGSTLAGWMLNASSAIICGFFKNYFKIYMPNLTE